MLSRQQEAPARDRGFFCEVNPYVLRFAGDQLQHATSRRQIQALQFQALHAVQTNARVPAAAADPRQKLM